MTRRPILTLAGAALLTAVSLYVTMTGLKFRSDRSDLIDPSLPWQRRYAEFKIQFPRWDDAAVVVDRGTTDGSRARAEAFLAALEALLRADPSFTAVTAGFPREEAPLGLILTQPLERVQEVVDRLSQAGPVVGARSLSALLGLSQLGGGRLGENERTGLKGLLERVHDAGEEAEAPKSVLGMEEAHGVERLVSSTGRLATVLVSIARPQANEPSSGGAEAGVNQKLGSLRALRAHIADLKARPELAGIEAGVTGVPVLESDETALSMRDATIASGLSLGLIALLMLIAYRGIVVPVFAVLSLLAGMAWSFGWATVSVGHLQLLSVTFASMLLGLGIDVAIHFIARLELVHADHEHLAAAIEKAFRGVGPGILTASITVSAASAAMALTSFKGVAEMGIIAAGGMILCTLSILCCLPALFMLMPRPEARLRSHEGGVSRPYMGRAGLGFHQHPKLVLAGAAVVFIAMGWLALRVRYDTDVLKLVPQTTESVVWQNRIEADDAKSVWHGLVTARDMDEARELTATLRGLDVVSDVGGIGMLFQPEEDVLKKQAVLAKLPDASAAAAAELEAPAPSANEVELVRGAARGLGAIWKEKDAGLSSAALAIVAMSDAEIERALRSYRADRELLLEQIAGLRGAREVKPEELPRALRDIMLGADGSLLLRIYPTAPEAGVSLLEPERLARFAGAMLNAAPGATGPVIQIHESSGLITRAYVQAGLYALLAIVIILLIDFGLSPGGALDTACALLPVVMGAVLMLAVMGVAGVALNFANMIVMPLIIGIGVGCGVHAVRRWRLQPHDRPLGLAGGSGRAITLTTMTTIIGFATMMTGQHRGLWSLGFVMSVGLAAVWVVTVLVLPSVLALRAVAPREADIS